MSGDVAFTHIDFSHAFQPIVDANTLKVTSYEVLLRGPNGEPPGQVFDQLESDEIAAFDQVSREQAVGTAVSLGVATHLNLNFFPGAILHQNGAYLEATIAAADRCGFTSSLLMIELTENEFVKDVDRLLEIVNAYRQKGLSFSIDDFGSGYAGLNLLADLQPEQLKLDIRLIQGIDRAGPRQSIVSAICNVCLDLGITVLAEGIETYEEYAYLKDAGIDLCQGYLFAKPGFECLPGISEFVLTRSVQAS